MKKFASLLAGLLLVLAGTLTAQVPSFINYQGRMAVAGVNFEGTGQFKFALVNGTTGASLWSNDNTSVAGSQPTAAVSIVVTHGLYSVLLGDTGLAGMSAIPTSAFANADVRLRIWFNDGTNGSQQLAPDQRFGSVPYAMQAATVPDGSITPAKLATGAVQTGLGVGTVTGVIGCNPPSPADVSVFIPGESVQATLGAATPSGYPFRLSNVPAGLQTITVRLAGGSTLTQQINVTAGGTHTADFTTLVKSYTDADGDGYGNPATERNDCTLPPGNVTNSLDFADSCSTCYPGAPEICDNEDNDGNNQTDENTGGQVCYEGPAATMGTGACHAGLTACSNGVVTCNGQVLPSAEACNGIDDDCNGVLDDGAAASCPATGDPCKVPACNGGACGSSNLPNGVVCVASSCSGNVQTNASTCMSGTCTGNGTVACAPYTCNGAAACYTSCNTNAQCQAGFNCIGGLCKKASGAACSSNVECASSFCVDGVCCNAACNGSCEKCNSPGTVGICTAIPANTDPDNECALNCNGARACQ